MIEQLVNELPPYTEVALPVVVSEMTILCWSVEEVLRRVGEIRTSATSISVKRPQNDMRWTIRYTTVKVVG